MELFICIIGFVCMACGFVNLIVCFLKEGRDYYKNLIDGTILLIIGTIMVYYAFPYYIFYGA